MTLPLLYYKCHLTEVSLGKGVHQTFVLSFSWDWTKKSQPTNEIILTTLNFSSKSLRPEKKQMLKLNLHVTSTVQSKQSTIKAKKLFGKNLYFGE